MKAILAAVDFSDLSSRVVKAASELARATRSRLYILHVAAPDPDFIGYGVGPGTVRQARARVMRKEHKRLQSMEARLRARGLPATALLIQGATVQKIVAEASRLKAAVVVVGSHGHGAIRKLLVGSVAEGVLRACPCPVLVVPAAFRVR